MSTQRPGEDVPDSRGRTGLHLVGLDLNRNPHVRVEDVRVVSDGWHVLRQTRLQLQRRDGRWDEARLETYDRGNGATVLPFDAGRRTVLLTRQFRYPVYVNDHPDGMMIEAAAGLLDADDPETAIRREAREELGIELGELTEVFQVYMSPGSVTERLHFYVAEYQQADARAEFAGLIDEGEEIEVLELELAEALSMIDRGEICDGKTIMLLQWLALHRLV